MMHVFARDSLRAAVEAASGGRTTVLYDARGNPHYMCVIPRFRYEDLGVSAELGTGWCTAFSADGADLPEIFVGQYQASRRDGSGDNTVCPLVTLPGMVPWRGSFNLSRGNVAPLGSGWHLLTVHEWAALVLWAVAHGTAPRGNTDIWGAGGFEGNSPDAPHEWGRVRQKSGLGLVLTGSGPATWRHDHTAHGIADLAGNDGQWLDGAKLVDGRLHVTPDNSFFDLDGTMVAQDAWLDTVGGAPQLAPAVVTPATATIADWQNITLEGGYTPNQLLARLLIEPAGVGPSGRAQVNNAGTRAVTRGRYALGSLDATGDWGTSLFAPVRLACVA